MPSLFRYSLLTLIFLVSTSQILPAQINCWTDVREADIQADPADRLLIPDAYRTLELDFAKMDLLLQSASTEEVFQQGANGIILAFPMPDGSTVNFEIWKTTVLHPQLQAKFPQIRAYAGRSTDHPGMLARIDISPYGFHAMFLNTGTGAVFIDPYARGTLMEYICFFKKDHPRRLSDAFICHTDDPIVIDPPNQVSDRAGDCGNRREYQLALACTGEYANFHGAFGANKAPALAAMNTSMNRVNGVYERDAGIRMIIIPNNDAVIFTDPDTDPYTNDDGGIMLGENQSTCDAIIGTNNYDIGHVFSTGGGGIATLNSPCNVNWKARGVTGLPSPVGDIFDIDYVSHEMGHQFGAQHTQYNNCNRSGPSAMEPGSASTIMGYAGICSPNVQSSSDDYFHARSLQQIGNFVTGSGGNCATLVPTGNAAPVVPNLVNRSIPHSTPFLLTGSATDPNGNPLSYCWEQMNAWSNPTQPMPPESTNSSGPMFRSFSPDGNNYRYCPRFEDVLSGFDFDWEELPSVNRTLSWRLTVRDNNPAGGCTTERNMNVTTSGSIGPFEVTSPNGGESFPGNSTQTITWNVAGSNNAPVSCANVAILLSLNGGASFSTLVGSTPNDGSETITFNAPVTSQARIMIQAVGNIFYDVSDNNFSFSLPLPIELISFNAAAQQNKVRLDWETATEKDNRGFYVERSVENAAAFATIGWVPGAGTTNTAQRYTFFDSDAKPNFNYYYRLRQTDFDGQEQYSPIRAVLLEGTGGTLLVLPNPASENIRVEVPAGGAELFGNIEILDLKGGLVSTQPIQNRSFELDVSGFETGLYFIRVLAEGRVFRGVFLRQ